ncbi:MAG: helix-turn-helix domain-containing protein [Magnetovibrio sp.]|nr:helix-turn-helix domain-containing protein [Magnetovibrio sp.]
MTSYRPVAAAVRCLDVLMATNRLRGRATVGEIHRHTGIDKSTIVRMLETLAHAGFVVRDEETPVYEVTGKSLLLSSGYDRHRAVGTIVSPIMTEFRTAIGWPSDAAIFDQDAMLLVETSRQAGPMLVNRHPGYRAPILATSLGMAYLAFCGAEERDAVLAQEAEIDAPWNLIARNPAEAAETFSAIRRQGYATMHPEYSRLEYSNKISSIGVPIMDGNKIFATINVLFLKTVLPVENALRTLLDPLVGAAARIGNELAQRSDA